MIKDGNTKHVVTLELTDDNVKVILQALNYVETEKLSSIKRVHKNFDVTEGRAKQFVEDTEKYIERLNEAMDIFLGLEV